MRNLKNPSNRNVKHVIVYVHKKFGALKKFCEGCRSKMLIFALRARSGGNRGTDPPGGGGQGQKFSKNKMFFRTQRTLSENILMICDPLPVKFLPQKNC